MITILSNSVGIWAGYWVPYKTDLSLELSERVYLSLTGNTVFTLPVG